MVLFALQAHYEMRISSGLVVAKAKVALSKKPNKMAYEIKKLNDLPYEMVDNKMREVKDVRIAGRKTPGYPTYSVNFTFNTVDDLLEQIDNAADEFEFSKIDTYIDTTENDVFTDDELEKLEEEYVILD